MSEAAVRPYREIFFGLFYPATGGAKAASSTVVSNVAYQGALGAVRMALQEDYRREFGQKEWAANSRAN